MDDAITLVGMTHGTDEYGNPVGTETLTRVLCRVYSVRGAEWYEASQQNIRLDYVFHLSTVRDYHGEEIVRYRDWTGTEKDYRVVRTYMKADGSIELTCSERVILNEVSQ